MKILMIVSEGFEEVEAMTPVDLLRRAGFIVDVCSITGKRNVKGARGIEIVSDKIIEEIELFDEYDGLILPGGLPNAHTLRDDDRVQSIVKEMNAKGKMIGAICAAPCVLEKAGILKGIAATSYPGSINKASCLYSETPVVRSKNIITSRGAGTAMPFALEMIDYLGGNATEIAKSIIYKET